MLVPLDSKIGPAHIPVTAVASCLLHRHRSISLRLATYESYPPAGISPTALKGKGGNTNGWTLSSKKEEKKASRESKEGRKQRRRSQTKKGAIRRHIPSIGPAPDTSGVRPWCLVIFYYFFFLLPPPRRAESGRAQLSSSFAAIHPARQPNFRTVIQGYPLFKRAPGVYQAKTQLQKLGRLCPSRQREGRSRLITTVPRTAPRNPCQRPDSLDIRETFICFFLGPTLSLSDFQFCLLHAAMPYRSLLTQPLHC